MLDLDGFPAETNGPGGFAAQLPFPKSLAVPGVHGALARFLRAYQVAYQRGNGANSLRGRQLLQAP